MAGVKALAWVRWPEYVCPYGETHNGVQFDRWNVEVRWGASRKEDRGFFEEIHKNNYTCIVIQAHDIERTNFRDWYEDYGRKLPIIVVSDTLENHYFDGLDYEVYNPTDFSQVENFDYLSKRVIEIAAEQRTKEIRTVLEKEKEMNEDIDDIIKELTDEGMTYEELTEIKERYDKCIELIQLIDSKISKYDMKGNVSLESKLTVEDISLFEEFVTSSPCY